MVRAASPASSDRRSCPLGVAFDGANISIANRGGLLTKIRDNDGTILGHFTVPTSPYSIAFDGFYIGVFGAFDNVVLRANDGAIVGQWQNDATTGVAFDGAHIWMSNLNLNPVTKY